MSLCGCSGLPVRPGSSFYNENIKKIEVRLLRFNFHDQGYYVANHPYVERDRAQSDGYDLYEKKLKRIIHNELESKGYTAEFGEPLSIDVNAGFWWGFPYMSSDANALYSAVEPTLKVIKETDGTDTILVFVIRFLQYRWASGNYTSPDIGYKYSEGYSPQVFETEDMTSLDINYHFYSLDSKRRLLANEFRGQRVHKVVSEQSFGNTKLIRWIYTETEDEFLRRCVSQLLKNIPEYR